MDAMIVHGGYKLKGKVKIEGAKNVTLPILAATLLADGTTTLTNVPIVTDVLKMCEILKSLNANVHFDNKVNEITVNADRKLEIEATNEVSQLRASILVMGALLARNGKAKVDMPGGCAIGKRPIDLHLKGFEALGAKIVQSNGNIEAIAEDLVGCNICFDFPSVGATQNVMMAAAKAKGTTVIENAAKEPEVIELANILIKMGAKIDGVGTKVIKIEGVTRLNGVKFEIVQDRHEAGTFMIAAAITEGDVLIENARLEHNVQLVAKLVEMGAVISQENDGIRVIGTNVIKPTNIQTGPYPMFPTDLQATLTAMLVVANGRSLVKETVFENRFQHLEEMVKMGADLVINGDVAVINGGDIVGTDVEASDLRAAAALVIAGLRAKGVTRVFSLKHLDRGYYKFHEKLQALGAKVNRVCESQLTYGKVLWGNQTSVTKDNDIWRLKSLSGR